MAFISVVGNFLSPYVSRRFRYKKWYLLISHFPYIGAWGLIGAVLLAANRMGLSTSVLLAAVMALHGLSFFFAGFVSLPHQEYTAACIPMSHRGRFNGYSRSIGSGLAMISAAVGGVVLLRVAKPASLGYLFIMTWLICQAGYLLAMWGREVPTPVDKAPRPWSRQMLIAAWNDKPFLKVLAIYLCCFILFLSVFGFVTQYGLRDLGMIDASAAGVALVSQIVTIALGGLVGQLVDRWGAKRLGVLVPALGSIALLPVLLVRNQCAVYVSISISALFLVTLWSAFSALLYGLPSPENRAGHYTVQILLGNAACAVGPIIVGRLCDVLSYQATFAIVAVAGICVSVLAGRLFSSLSADAKDYA